MVAVTATAMVATTPAQLVGEAAAKPRHKRYCSARSYRLACIWVPRNAHRPAKIKPQAPPVVAPRNVVNGGGVGGGGQRELGAVDWAQGQQGSTNWSYRSERFVEEAFATRGADATPRAAAGRLKLHPGSPRLAPPGSLMLFDGDPFNRGLGHIGLSLGNGRMLSALADVHLTNVVKSPYWSDLYLGWAKAPSAWGGRLPLPPGLTVLGETESVEFISPTFGETYDDTVHLAARAHNGGAIEFHAYYATDPLRTETLEWHSLGRGKDAGDGTQVLDWDSTAVPDQGNPKFGTVQIDAFALDAAGNPRGGGAFRRITIIHAAR